MRRTFVLKVILGLGIVGSASLMGWSAVETWEGTITIPTYPWAEDVNPKFFALESSIIYPYTMQDMLSTEKEERIYKALFLENEYLKITCLPELAGRIYSVLDKSTGEEMFHTNRVVKPGMIAMRGAWISGGIEWNTGPHGHSVTIVSPVDAAVLRNRDGSASLVIGNTEKIFRTRWEVYLTLHPGKSYLDERIRIYNPTDFVHPYYFWNCTAFYCLPGTRFIYPMTLGCDHNGTSFFTWPMHEGKDLTWLKNYDRPTSIFAYDCAFDFFGAYDVDLDRGIVQYANHNELIGKKAWTWGQSGDGIVSQRNLHEGDEQYIEVQSGPLLTQADYGLLYPRNEIQWREWWYPVHGMKDGFEYAAKDVAVQRIERQGMLEYRLISTGDFRRASIQFHQNGEVVGEKRIHLSPTHPTVVETDLKQDAQIDIVVRDGSDQILASYHSPLPIPHRIPPEPDWKSTKQEADLSVEEIYLKGLLFDKQTNRPAAREWYLKALDKDSHHAPSLKGLAVLDMEAGLFESAVEFLQKAIQRNPDDGMAWFYLGSSFFHLQQEDEALTCAYKSARNSATKGIACDLIGRIYMRQKLYLDALKAFEKSLDANPEDVQTRRHRLLSLFASGNRKAARNSAQEMAKENPIDLIPPAILALLSKNEWKDFEKIYTNLLGEKEFELLEASLTFAELGLYPEAYQILLTVMNGQKPPSQLNSPSYYYLALWADRLGKLEDADSFVRLAENILVDGMFPSRLETIAPIQYVIQKATEAGIKPAHSYLHLGNLYGGLGRLDDAVKMWRQAVQLSPSLSVGHRNLGLTAWKKEHDLKSAASHYRKAILARPEDQTLYRDLAGILISDQQRSAAIELLETMPGQDARRTDVTEILAQAYVDEADYSKAIRLLNDSFFSNWENRTMSRNVFVRAHIERGKQFLEQKQYQSALDDFSIALTYPDNLGVGRPADPSEAEPLYWQGKAFQLLGKLQEARQSWRQGEKSHPRSYREKCSQALSE
ncbi:MAG: DUF5107 domain-containing protein [Candidatus Omnitrophica bacterium]|nr:DUF5107 domain-containing protein [Candidatus Omnitrophota bacterium]